MLNAKDYPHVTKRGNGQLPMYRCFYIILYNDHLHQQAKTWGGAVILLWLICPLRHKTISKLHFLRRALWIATSDWRILHRTYCHWLTERKRIKLTCPREKVDHVLIFDVSAFQDKIGGTIDFDTVLVPLETFQTSIYGGCSLAFDYRRVSSNFT